MNLPTTLKRLLGAIVIFLAAPSVNAAASIVVPGCAPIHPPTCVQWKKQKSGGWTIQNNCGASVSVTLEKHRLRTGILHPGQIGPIDIKPAQYLVFDSDEWEKWVESIPKRSWGEFHASYSNPCEDKLLVAQQSGGGNSNAGQAPSSPATNSGSIPSANCPDETSSEYAIFKYLGNGRFACANKINRIFGDCMTAANVDTWFKGSPMGLEAHEQRSVVAWAHCKLDNDRGWNAKGTQAQVNVGNASEVNGRKESGKSAWKRGDSQTSQSQSQQEADAGAQGSNGSPKSKYVSKDATHCVEMVPKGFKCDGPYDRFLTNICMTKISVRWRLGSDPWGMQELAPKGCTPVSPFRDQRSVQFKACSWDPKASHGPYLNPCRY